MATISQQWALFGGDLPWNPADWTSSDDHIRGGRSESHFECPNGATSAVFHGTLDVQTLGNAGFASQRTASETQSWDLSAYDGILLKIERADDKRYTFILKDALAAARRPDGRAEATVSYEYDFQPGGDSIIKAPSGLVNIFIPWSVFKATFRGRVKPDAPPLELTKICRMSFMMRSFFGQQEGPFSLTVRSISATTGPATLSGSWLHHRHDLHHVTPVGPEEAPRLSPSCFDRCVTS